MGIARAGAVAVVCVLAACTHPAPTPGGPTAAAAPDASPPDAGPARILYQRGTIYHPTRAGDDRYTCIGTPDEETACQAVRPGHACHLESPVGYWEGEIRCKGTAMTDWEEQAYFDRERRLTVPHCECDCTDAHIAAYDAFQRRLEACANVP